MVQRTGIPDFRELFRKGQWRRMILYKTDTPRSDGYLYKGDGYAFGSEEELQGFLNTFCGTIVPDGKEYTVWYCCEVIQAISRAEWSAIESPVIGRFIDDHLVCVKMVKDIKRLTVFTYYCMK